MTRHVRIPLLIAVVLGVERGVHLGRARPRLQGREPTGRQAGRRPPLAHDARGQGRSDDPGRARAVRQARRDQPERQRRRHHHLAARLDPLRWRLHPGREHAEGVGRHGRPLPDGGARDPAGHPADLRHRLRPRRRQHARRDRLPAQHRPRRHARPGPRARGRAHHRVGDALDRTAVELRAVHLRRARRPLGPHRTRASARTRALVEKMETAIDGFQGSRPGSSTTATACSRPRSTTPATATRNTAPATATTRSTRASTVTNRRDFWNACARASTSPPCRSTTSAA